MLLAPVIALVGMAAAIIGHVFASRAGAGRVQAYVRSLLAGAVVTAMLCGISVTRDAIDGWIAAIALLLLCSWCFIFINIVQAMESSIRVRLVREMMAGGGLIPRAQLEESYNDGGLVRLRLDRLLAVGAVTKRDGHLFVTSASSYWLARFFRFLKVILIGKRSEFNLDAASPPSRGL